MTCLSGAFALGHTRGRRMLAGVLAILPDSLPGIPQAIARYGEPPT